MVKLTKHSVVTLHDLAIRRENDDELLVGRTDTSRYALVPNVGADIIERLGKKETIAEIEQALLADDPEPVDVIGFVEELIYEYKFVHRIDNAVVSERALEKGHFSWIPPFAGNILFQPQSFIIAAALLILAIGLLILYPAFFPTYQDFYVSSSLTLNMTFALAIAWVLLFIHELAHVTAARSLEVACRLGIGHRYVFPVAETDMTNIVLVPRRDRYRAYLAGMLIDVVWFAVGVWIQAFHQWGILTLDQQTIVLIRMVHIHVLHILLFQFLIFMKTDLYYVITTLLRCERLLEHTYLYIRLLARFTRNTDVEDWKTVQEREKKIIYGYVWFVVGGLALTLIWFIRYYIPLVFQFCAVVADRLSAYPVWSWSYLDALLLLVMSLLPLGVLSFSWFARMKALLRKGGEKR